MDLPLPHDRHHISQGEGLCPVVSHNNRWQSQMSQQAPELPSELKAGRGVQRRQGFVEQEQLRPRRDRPGKRHPLLLAAGQFSRFRRFKPLQLEQLHHLCNSLVPLRGGQGSQSIPNIPSNGIRGEEGIVLRHVPDLSILRGHPDPRPRIQPGPRHELDSPLFRPFQSRNGSENRRFTGPGRTEQDQNSRGLDFIAETGLNGRPTGKGLGHVDGHFCGHTAHTFRFIA